MVFVAIFPLITVSNCSTTILSDLASFCKDNGMRYVKIVSRKNKLNIAKHIFDHGIQAGFNITLLNFAYDTQIIFGYDYLEIKTNESIDSIEKHKIKRSILTFTKALDLKKEKDLMQFIKSKFMNTNSFFYLVYPNSKGQLKYKQVISLRNNTHVIIQEVSFQGNNSAMTERYNLENMRIYSNTISWHPYLMVDDCDNLGQNCDVKG